MKIKILLPFLFAFLFCGVYANPEDYRLSKVPVSLMKDANAVVRLSAVNFEYKNEKSVVEKRTEVITMMNKAGKELAEFYCHTDQFRSLKSFSAQLIDINGKVLRKYKMSDLEMTEYSPELAHDGRMYYFTPEPPSFPVTIAYEYEVTWKNGILVFPYFYPQHDYYVSLEKAEYILSFPEKVEFRKKAVNMEVDPETNPGKNGKEYTWKVESCGAIEKMPFTPPLSAFVPRLYLAPVNFFYDKVEGTITDWETMSSWQHQLLKDRDILPESARNKIIQMTEKAQTTREKVKILYDYLGETTRYVSIQLGIGGYQPMPAAEVYKTGFGDCKALTNYLKAMLAVIGIESDYLPIEMSRYRKELFADYPGFNQINHVILQVPLEKDTLWLECTNPRVPFGFIHSGIAGHDGMLVAEKGGRLCRLRDYPDSLNIEKNKAEIILQADGKAMATSSKEYHVKIYDYKRSLLSGRPSEQTDAMRKNIRLPNVKMGEVKVREDKSALPAAILEYSWETPLYGSKTGTRLFILVNPFQAELFTLKKTERTQKIVINTGFKDTDSLYVVIPEGFEIESIPKPVSLQTAFGLFESNVQEENEGIRIHQTLYIRSGEYPAEDYSLLTDFWDKINSSYQDKIILRKKKEQEEID